MTGVCNVKHTMEAINKEWLLALHLFGACHITQVQHSAAGPLQRHELLSQTFAPTRHEEPHTSVCLENIPAKLTSPRLSYEQDQEEKKIGFFSSCNLVMLQLGLLICADHGDFHKLMIHRVSDIVALSFYCCFACIFSVKFLPSKEMRL